MTLDLHLSQWPRRAGMIACDRQRLMADVFARFLEVFGGYSLMWALRQPVVGAHYPTWIQTQVLALPLVPSEGEMPKVGRGVCEMHGTSLDCEVIGVGWRMWISTTDTILGRNQLHVQFSDPGAKQRAHAIHALWDDRHAYVAYRVYQEGRRLSEFGMPT